MTKLNFYSLGIVAEDKIKDDWFIYVIPMEQVPTITGDIQEKIQVTGENKDNSGNITSLQVEKKKWIKADWMPNGVFNRSSPPDVTKGMTVAIYNYAGTSDYYWTTLFFEADLLKQEKVTYFWSSKANIAKEGDDLLSKGYYLTVDTFEKYIRLHTSKSNEEAISYDLEIDTGNGVVTLQDDKGNLIQLESQDGNLNINLNKNMNIAMKEDATFKTDKNIDITLDKISVKNNTAELIDLLTQLVQANINEQHMGNMGAPTALMSTSQQEYQQILDKLKTFKK